MGAADGQDVPSNAKGNQEAPGKPTGIHKVQDQEVPGEARSSQEEQKEPKGPRQHITAATASGAS